MSASAAAVDWGRARASFPGLDDKVFLDAACVSLAPREACDAIAAFLDTAARMPSADATEHHVRLDEGREATRREAASLIGAAPDEIALVESTSHGLNTVAFGLALTAAENVVLCDLDFVGVAAPWAARARETGVDLRFVRHRDGRVEVEDVARAVDENTRAICLSSVLWSNGLRLDLPGLSRLARDRGALLVLDSIQHLGALRLDVRETPADVIACGGHKWLNAPFGCGFLYVRREAQAAMRPLTRSYLSLTPPPGGWESYFATPDISPLRAYDFVSTAQRFEIGGTSNYPGAAGLGASLAMINTIGPAAIEARVLALGDRLIEGLRGAGFRLVSPVERERRSGIVAFTAGGDAVEDARLLARLRERRICISQRYTRRIGGLRASVHFFNNEDDVDALVREAARARSAG